MVALPSAAHIKRFATDPDFFRRNLMIDARGHKKRFEPEPWQDENLKALDPIWTRVAGLHDNPGPKQAWLGRPKGHSKTTDEAMQLVWAMCFSTRRITGLAVASATDQAKFLREGVIKLVLHNPWLAELIEVQGRTVVNKATGSHMDICSGEETISQGSEPDFVLIDELTHWGSEKLWDTMLSSSDKRDHCCLIVMTNAGFKERWHWKHREIARTNPKEWVFRDFDKPMASWSTEKVLENQRRSLSSEKEFRRLWLNEWQEEASDELSREDVMQCVDDALEIWDGTTAEEHDWIFLAGLDIGIRKDKSGFVILACNPVTHKIRVVYSKDWKPDRAPKKKGRKSQAQTSAANSTSAYQVKLEDVEKEIILRCQQYGISKVFYDPAQAEGTAQRCRDRGIQMEMFPFTTRNTSTMAARIINVFREKQIELRNDKKLIADILKLKIVNKGFVHKIEAATGTEGHADLGFAFAIALPAAVEIAGQMPIDYTISREIVRTMDDLQRALDGDESATEDDELKAKSYTGPILTGIPCPNCRKMLRGTQCECGEQYQPMSEVGMVLQEAGIEW